MDERLTEEQVSDAFHSYVKSGLAQAKIEGLLDTELLSSAEADLMITGPALCLYFTALRCTTSPPSVTLPTIPGSSDDPVDLSLENCPSPFVPFMSVWARNVQIIQDLTPDQQHDLARIICGLPPIFTSSSASLESPSSSPSPSPSPVDSRIKRIAAELRAVAIEISQRRTFQDRYAADLQAAIDEGSSGRMSGRRRVLASFKPPPTYDEASLPSSSRSHSPAPSPSRPPSTSPSSYPAPRIPFSPGSPTHAGTSTYKSRDHITPPQVPPKSVRSRSQAQGAAPVLSPASPSRSFPSSAQGLRERQQQQQHHSFAIDTPAIQLIRETLYASLADVLASHLYLRQLLKRDPPRAYFASVALAILNVSLSRTEYRRKGNGKGEGGCGRGRGRGRGGEHQHQNRVDQDAADADVDVIVHGVLSTQLHLAACPVPLQPFMRELGAIGAAARAAQEEDTMHALAVLERNPDAVLPPPRMERVRRMLERGIYAEDEDGEKEEKEKEKEKEKDEVSRSIYGGSERKQGQKLHQRESASSAIPVGDPSAPAAGGRGRSSHRHRIKEEPPYQGHGNHGRNDNGRGRRSIEGRALVLVNRINALALGMTKLRAFNERQNEIFKILVGVVS